MLEIWGGLKKSVGLIYGEAKFQANMAKLKTEVNRFEHEKHLKLEELGKKIYEDFLKNPESFNLVVQNLCSQLQSFDEKINQKNSEAELLKKEYQISKNPNAEMNNRSRQEEIEDKGDKS